MVKQQSDVMLDRDASVAAVMEKEVLSKHRKALMLFGTFHFFHDNETAPAGLGISSGALRTGVSRRDHGDWDSDCVSQPDSPSNE